jgi:hypothetical protein
METTNTVGREILDSRGNPTVGGEAVLDHDSACERTRSCSTNIREHEEAQARRSNPAVQQVPVRLREGKGDKCDRTTCTLKGRLVEWFELVSLAMLLITGLVEHVMWAVRWVEEAMHH